MSRAKSFDRVRETRTAEYKSMPLLRKAIDPDTRTVTTLFSVFGNIDSYSDRVMPGAFAQTFAQRGSKVLHLWQHDFFSPPIAVVKSLREIGRDELPADVQRDYPEAQGGAEAVSQFLTSPRASEVFDALAAGAPLEASFGYDVVDAYFTEEDDRFIRNIREVRLWELSTVLWGANPAARGSKMLDTALTVLRDVKAGNRHSSADYDLIDQIAAAAVDLGARNVALRDTSTDDTSKSAPTPDEERRAANLALTLTQRRAAISLVFGE